MYLIYSIKNPYRSTILAYISDSYIQSLASLCGTWDYKPSSFVVSWETQSILRMGSGTTYAFGEKGFSICSAEVKRSTALNEEKLVVSNLKTQPHTYQMINGSYFTTSKTWVKQDIRHKLFLIKSACLAQRLVTHQRWP